MACRDIFKAKYVINSSETDGSHATNFQGMHCYCMFLYLLVLAIIVVLSMLLLFKTVSSA